jgi:hypothetical protein
MINVQSIAGFGQNDTNHRSMVQDSIFTTLNHSGRILPLIDDKKSISP